jgi:hypothetical protein
MPGRTYPAPLPQMVINFPHRALFNSTARAMLSKLTKHQSPESMIQVNSMFMDVDLQNKHTELLL